MIAETANDPTTTVNLLHLENKEYPAQQHLQHATDFLHQQEIGYVMVGIYRLSLKNSIFALFLSQKSYCTVYTLLVNELLNIFLVCVSSRIQRPGFHRSFY
uniref:Uncharacterized protein n=1 Tax=Ditylenchus dipsaci TaxID=166011 RepID=A0A915DYA3_9BILA